VHPLKNFGVVRARNSLRLWATGFVWVAISFSWPARAEDGADSHHTVWLQGQVVPFAAGGGDNSESAISRGGSHIGAAGGYAFRFAKNMSVGLGLTFHRPGGNDYYSSTVLSVPLLVSFDPHVSRTVRLVMTAGLGYQEVWGNHTYGGNAWKRSGCEVAIDFGVAVQVAPKLALLASVGARVMLDVPPFDWALPIGVGIRYTP
jgi:hypothetical protein